MMDQRRLDEIKSVVNGPRSGNWNNLYHRHVPELIAEIERLQSLVADMTQASTSRGLVLESLLAENERLRAALGKIANSETGAGRFKYTTGEGHAGCLAIARAALEGGDE